METIKASINLHTCTCMGPHTWNRRLDPFDKDNRLALYSPAETLAVIRFVTLPSVSVTLKSFPRVEVMDMERDPVGTTKLPVTTPMPVGARRRLM